MPHDHFIKFQCSTVLPVFKGLHDEGGEAQSEDVGHETGVEIRPA